MEIPRQQELVSERAESVANEEILPVRRISRSFPNVVLALSRHKTVLYCEVETST